MFDPFTIALIGGAAGGLLNKKNPLQGAAMGAGMGALGASVAPGLLSGAPGLTAAPAASGGLTLGAGEGLKLGTLAPELGGAASNGLLGATPSTLSSMGGGTGLTAAAPTGGLQPGMWDKMKDGLGKASEYAQPVGNAATAANAVGGLFQQPPKAPIQPGPTLQNSGGAQTLASIAQSNAQGTMTSMDDAMKRRMMQQQIIARMMGRG